MNGVVIAPINHYHIHNWCTMYWTIVGFRVGCGFWLGIGLRIRLGCDVGLVVWVVVFDL